MLFVDANSHLTTKPYNFDIKCQCNLESYDQHVFFGTHLRGGGVKVFFFSFFFINLQWEIFPTTESSLGLTGWTCLLWKHC